MKCRQCTFSHLAYHLTACCIGTLTVCIASTVAPALEKQVWRKTKIMTHEKGENEYSMNSSWLAVPLQLELIRMLSKSHAIISKWNEVSNIYIKKQRACMQGGGGCASSMSCCFALAICTLHKYRPDVEWNITFCFPEVGEILPRPLSVEERRNVSRTLVL